MTIQQLCLVRDDDRFTRERTDHPVFMRRSYAKIVLSAKGQSDHFVRENLIQISYCSRKYRLSVSVRDDLMQDHTICKRTEHPFLDATI